MMTYFEIVFECKNVDLHTESDRKWLEEMNAFCLIDNWIWNWKEREINEKKKNKLCESINKQLCDVFN